MDLQQNELEKQTKSKQPIQVVVVEDLFSEFEYIKPMLSTFFASINTDFNLKYFNSAHDFVEKYSLDTDLIILDIELGAENGMDAAKKIREIDEDVVIIFCTKMAQFAVSGYQVNALDFLVKPYTYDALAFRLHRAMKAITKDKRSNLIIKTKSGFKNLLLKEIMYLDVFGHSLGFHTISGTIYTWGSLTKYEESLRVNGFFRCSNSCLVNSYHIDYIRGKEIKLDNGETLQISRPRHKSFMKAMSEWAGEKAK